MSEYTRVLKMVTDMRAAQKRYFLLRTKDALEKSKKLEREMDEYLKKANHADNLQQDLFTDQKIAQH